MGVAMRKWMVRWIRPVGWTVAAALVVVLTASCAMGEPMTDAEMACCAAMGHDCGAMADMDCCSHGQGRTPQFVAATAAPVPPPTAALIAVVAVPGTPQAGLRFVSRPLFTGTSLRPARIPTYLLISTLLI